MRSAPENDRARRLEALSSRFRTQERFMTAALQDLQDRLEHWHREAAWRRLQEAEADPTVARCVELQEECDDLATELVHVRMAISGADEELASGGRLLMGA